MILAAMSQAYRPEIDGLRAIAVLSVVAFHFAPTAVPGGFVGVDIFFVISGYLITQIIARELEAGNFSLLRFYERRARRIVPALAFVVIASSIAAWWLFLPEEMVQFAKSVRYVCAFLANFLWARIGYFGPQAETQPLLHLWSLGVEEQFYIIFPLILILLFRRSWNIKTVIASAFIASLAASCWAVVYEPQNAFYLPQYRAWELLTGSVLALGMVPSVGNQAREIATVAGLVLIAGSVWLISSATPFPGLAALAPCLGAALVIMGGASRASAIIRVRPWVFVGLISYSLYLWHWPILVFAKKLIQDEPTTGEIIALAGLSIAMATISWEFVEKPFREKRLLPTRSAALAASSAVLVLGVLAAVTTRSADGFPNRWPADVAQLARGVFDENPRRSECDERVEDPCVIGDTSAKVLTFAIVGDSHAGAMWPALEQAAINLGLKGVVLTQPACAPMLGVRYISEVRSEFAGKCRAFYPEAIRFLDAHPDIKQVLLVGRWSGPLDSRKLQLQDDLSKTVSNEESDEVFKRGISRLIAALPGRAISLSGPIPEYSFSVPTRLAENLAAGRSTPLLTSSEFAEKSARVATALSAVAGSTQSAVFQLSPAFCDDVCALERGGLPLYFDDDHPSIHALPYLEPLFERHLRTLIANRG